MTVGAIAIVGVACRFPDARNPEELWQNVLARRRAFRTLPDERLRLMDYWSADRNAPDRTYATQAAVIEGYEFDRTAYHVAGSTYRAADLAHWLALDVAAMALSDAGWADGRGLPKDTTGVIVGNSLTGEFSRANTLRLRWPYVARTLQATLAEAGLPEALIATALERAEVRFKAPFPPVLEETLAGGLANTIAGRVANHFDLRGGGYTVDGACSSSLLALHEACRALSSDDLDVAIVGGVDLSIDPFELVGFAKMGALAEREMRVYDEHAEGFWPGEGCGFAVLMRANDAERRGLRVRALVRGWGIASDGAGGLTRPDVDGQALAVRRALMRAEIVPGDIDLFEGHGTGTPVGDAVELQALTEILPADASPVAVGSVKANIGHTKAAAGMAGLIKTVLALEAGLLPPATGIRAPRPEVSAPGARLRVLDDAELVSSGRTAHAGVSSFGFGGINVHAVLEAPHPARLRDLTAAESRLLRSPQDAELFLLCGPTAADVAEQAARLVQVAPRLAEAELADAAAALARGLGQGAWRAAIVAATPADLASALDRLLARLGEGSDLHRDESLAIGRATRQPRIGFLFPGQAAPVRRTGGSMGRRFELARVIHAGLVLPEGDDTASAQPAIVAASLAGLRVLRHVGIEADVAVGHSLGEITGLAWAGALSEVDALATALARGSAMAIFGRPEGAMAAITAGAERASALIAGLPLNVAGVNAADQTVIAGDADAISIALDRAAAAGIPGVRLPVSHAFHSPHMAPAVPAFARHLAELQLRRPAKPLISTITGRLYGEHDRIEELLIRQLAEPVLFMSALQELRASADLLIEVGPGAILTDLAARNEVRDVASIDAAAESLFPLLRTLGAAFVAGAPLAADRLFDDRFVRPFDLTRPLRFFANPCESAPPRPTTLVAANHGETAQPGAERPTIPVMDPPMGAASSDVDLVELVTQLVATRVELPRAAIGESAALLADLHLNSIAVGQLVGDACRALGIGPPVAPTSFASATVATLAAALGELLRVGSPPAPAEALPAGIESWVRTFSPDLVRVDLAKHPAPGGVGDWEVVAGASSRLAKPLAERLRRVPGSGVALCLTGTDGDEIGHFLDAIHRFAVMPQMACLLIVNEGGAAWSGVARSVHQEYADRTTCLIQVPADAADALNWVIAEVEQAIGFVESRYTATGTRLEPRLRLRPIGPPADTFPVGPRDVVLVTGGARGIGAECALRLGEASGAYLVVWGRSEPGRSDVVDTLDRFRAHGVRAEYMRVEIGDRAAVAAGVAALERAHGPVTAILHAAGANDPAPVLDLSAGAFEATLRPKVAGAQHLLAAIDRQRLRLFVAFGSVIAETGMRGEAHYALANACLADVVRSLADETPSCRCLTLEWSVWAGTGMGERLGLVETLRRSGITPIPIDRGTDLLMALLADPTASGSIVVAGRLGTAATMLPVSAPPLPMWRFLERVPVYYPGIEIVAEARLSPGTDPYLDDHVVAGVRVLPAVMALEAMAQVAMALAQTREAPCLQEIRFERAITVPSGGTTIRVAAYAREPSRLEIVVRSADTEFAVDCVRAVCDVGVIDAAEPRATEHAGDRVALAPDELYGDLLFQRGRFARIAGYRFLAAGGCVADIQGGSSAGWFAPYLPQYLVLGDPGRRDALFHAVQACVPDQILLPVALERFAPVTADGPMQLTARRRSEVDGTFLFDLVGIGTAGEERLDGVAFRAAGSRPVDGSWLPALAGPHAERRVAALWPGRAVGIALHETGASGGPSDRAMTQVAQVNGRVLRRADGKPEVVSESGRAISSAHDGPLTLAVASDAPVGCDLESVRHRTVDAWLDLIGADGLQLARAVANGGGVGDLDCGATMVWAARESVLKAGLMADTPLVLDRFTDDGWTMLRAGDVSAACWRWRSAHDGIARVLALAGGDERAAGV